LLLLLLLEKSDGIRPTFIFVKRKRGNKQNAKQKRERRREYIAAANEADAFICAGRWRIEEEAPAMMDVHVFILTSFFIFFFFFSPNAFVSFIYSTPFTFRVEEKRDRPTGLSFRFSQRPATTTTMSDNKLLNRLEGRKNWAGLEQQTFRGALMSYTNVISDPL
jgi:hypothetical protein